MNSFIKKRITTNLTLGERLVKAREAKNLSLEQAVKLTKIQKEYLKALEKDDYNQLPGEIYTKSFLKVYANLLGLEFQEVLSLYLSEKKIYQKTNRHISDFKEPVKKLPGFYLWATPKIIKALVIVLVIVICLVYLGKKIELITSPPILLVSSPTENLITNQRMVKVIGQTEEDVNLTINGQQVFPDNNGYFQELVDLQTGTNIIEISATKRYSKESTVYRKILVTENNQ